MDRAQDILSGTPKTRPDRQGSLLLFGTATVALTSREQACKLARHKLGCIQYMTDYSHQQRKLVVSGYSTTTATMPRDVRDLAHSCTP